MAIKGMDISYWQGNVDFARVAADGIKFAILREGYAQTVDAKFRQYVEGCRKNGIEIKGVYHFSYAINAELANYSEELARKPQVIAANKTDAIYDLEESPVEQLRKEFGPKGIDVFPISAVSGKGVNELLYHVRQMLDGLDEKPTVFEQEYFPEMALAVSDEPYTVTYDELEQEYVVEGPRIEKMLGYTNLESEKGFAFFQGFLKDAGILDKLEEGDVFYLHVLDEVLAYKVDQIKVVLPEETQDIGIVEGKDYCTLVTCTPYAINTHRLLVRGERTEYIPPEELAEQNAVHEVQSQTITKRIVDVWPWLVVSLLIVAGVEGSIFLLIVKRQRSYGDVREKRKKGKRSSRSCNKTRRKK